MARIAGVDIPDNKRGEIALTYIYGIGRKSAQNILTKVGVNWDKKAKEWNDEESNAIRATIAEQFKIPVKFIGVGEKMEDLLVFDKHEFVDSLFNLEKND